MEPVSKAEELIRCPYNDCHYVMRKRMERHLVLCRKNYPEKKLIRCDFNSTHEIPQPELQYHYEICPDKKKMELACYKEKTVGGANDAVDMYPIKNIEVAVDDSWEDCATGTYNPREHCEKNAVLVRLDVAPPSKKKHFRLEQRQKMLALQQQQEKGEDDSGEDPVENAPVSQVRDLKALFPETKKITENEAKMLRDAENMIRKLTVGSKNIYVAQGIPENN